MKRPLLLTLMLSVCCALNAGDEFCGIKNTAFQAGETARILFTIHWAFI